MAKYSPAVTAARARRRGRAGRSGARFEWFIDNVMQKTRMTMHKRVTIAGEYLKTMVVKNINIPVVQIVVGGRDFTVRSKKGEFPRADTENLRNTIFTVVKNRGRDIVDAYVGTPLDYGFILETSKRLRRSFLLRTLREEKAKIARIIDGPIK